MPPKKPLRLSSLLLPLLALLFLHSAGAEPPFGATPLSPERPPKPLAPTAPVAWKAGAASERVTPDNLLWMAGYASRKKPAEGKVQDLFAKALALEDEAGSRFVFVTLDLIGVPRDLRLAIAEEAKKRFHLPPESLLLNASHTHSGPALRTAPPTPQPDTSPATPASSAAPAADTPSATASSREADSHAYTRILQARILSAIERALKDLQPARITWNKARCGFAMNRRRDYTLPPNHPNANKAPNPDGPVDQDVPALRIESPDGTLRATLFGYACHNTCLGFQFYCGDYAGYAQEYLQQHRPGFTALFLMGCGGDQNPYPRRSDVVPGITDLELAQQHGRSLANAVEMALTANPRPVTGPIRAAYREVLLDYSRSGHAPHPYPVQIVRLGNDLEFIALGSEVVVDYSLRFKAELGHTIPIWVAGYSNDYHGYIPSLRVLREGGYEANAGWAESVEERIASTVHALHQQVDSSKNSAPR